MSAGSAYRFGEFTLDPASRLLQRGDVRVDVPRRVFDCLQYLIEHRERAVGREELIEKVWKRSNVSDNQLAQTVLAARKLIGDAGARQTQIRTVAGFGYHWVGAIEMVSATAEAPTGPAPRVPAIAPAVAGALPARPRSSWATFAAVLLALLLASAAGVWWANARQSQPESASQSTPGEIWVLPALLSGEDESWARVGLMALIAEDLRRRGATVMPVENVLVRLAAQPSELPPEHWLQAGSARLVIATSVHRSAGQWQVELSAHTSRDPVRQIEASAADLLHATRLAVTDLGTRLQLPGPASTDAGRDAHAMIEQAIRSRDVAMAQSLLERLGPEHRARPDTALLEIALDRELGRYAAAQARIEQLAPQLDAQQQPAAYARMQLLRASIMLRLDEPGWPQLADDVIALLGDAPPQRELATALLLRGTAAAHAGRLQDAAQDFARSREISLSLLDEASAASAASNLARVSMLDGRPAEALQQLQEAVEVFAAHSAEGATLRALRSIQSIQFGMRRWDDALATTERMREKQARSQNVQERVSYQLSRTLAMLGLGRLREAEALLAATADVLDEDGMAYDARYTAAAYRALLELARRNWPGAHAAAQQGFEQMQQRHIEELRDQSEQLVYLSILARRRASASASQLPPPSAGQQRVLESASTSFGLVGRALWAAEQGDQALAERAFQEAMDAAERVNRLSSVLAVAEGWIGWLLEHDRLEDAAAVHRRLLARDPGLVERDFEAARLALRLQHARQDLPPWRKTAARALALAGERELPPEWLPPQ